MSGTSSRLSWCAIVDLIDLLPLFLLSILESRNGPALSRIGLICLRSNESSWTHDSLRYWTLPYLSFRDLLVPCYSQLKLQRSCLNCTRYSCAIQSFRVRPAPAGHDRCCRYCSAGHYCINYSSLTNYIWLVLLMMARNCPMPEWVETESHLNLLID